MDSQLFEPDALDGAAAGLGRNGRLARHEPLQELLDDVHEFVELSGPELAVLDHPALMRLRRVKQLGMTDLVFPTGTHVRREHAIGTLHVAHLILKHVDRNLKRAATRSPSKQYPADDRPLMTWEICFTRLAALLHDIGHLPSGHTFEDELGLLDKHDHPPRLTLILDRPAEEWDVPGGKSLLEDRPVEVDEAAPNELTLRELIDREYEELRELCGVERSPSEIVMLLIAGDAATEQEVAEFDLKNAREVESGVRLFRLGVCRDIVSNTVSADLLDYLLRDWQRLGKPQRLDRRLLQYMEIRRPADPLGPPVLAVDLRSAADIRTDAISSILHLLDRRYELFEMALYHRTKLNAASMLERVVAELADLHPDHGNGWLMALPKQLLDISDDELYGLLIGEARELAKRPGADEGRLREVERTLRALRQRRLHGRLLGLTYNQLPNRAEVQKRYGHEHGDVWTDPHSPARNRLHVLRQLEQDFGLAPLTLGMYCPPKDMSDKIARVKVRVDDRLAPLNELEEARGDRDLTGGRLGGQTSRFKQLWRVHFSCEPRAMVRLKEGGLFGALMNAIKLLVLDTPDDTPVEERFDDIVDKLRRAGIAPYRDFEVIENPGATLAAPGDGMLVAQRGEQLETYPTGYGALRHAFRRK